MKEFIITAKTTEGAAALKKQYTRKLSLKEKMAFKSLGYSQIMLLEDPYTLVLRICNNRMEQPDMEMAIKKEIINGLPSVAIDVDYTIGVKAE